MLWVIGMQLQIRHVENPNGQPQFEVIRDGKNGKAVILTPPTKFRLEEHNIDLQEALKWYLEEYLEMPISGNQTKSKAVEKALAQWGKDTFVSLFDSGLARGWYQEARQGGLTNLHIKIVSDSPGVLAWPWEALESADDGCLALQCCMERQLYNIADALPPSEALPKDRLNILYIITRPLGEKDVGFQTLARPLADFVFAGEEGWPVHIDLLRPPTFDRLQEVLHEKPSFYHIVHFDGHGRYDGINNGALIFEAENDSGKKKNPVSAEKLGELLREYNIPVMVLNACRSAMLDEKAENPFASVAAALMKAGVYSVVAMSYILWVSGAKEFIPAFYQVLLESGSIAEAVRLGRRRMYNKNMRDTIFGEVKFNDWMVPVLYQQLPLENSVIPQLNHCERYSSLPSEISSLDYGFIGRDRNILQLERAIQRQPQAGILIHGISGEGKTTLAKGFLQWLEATNGLGQGAFWFSFEDIHNADYIIDTLAVNLFDTRILTLPREEMFSTVIKRLRAERYFLLWDNFESASEIPGTEVSALIPKDGRQVLKRFLHELRGGKTKVLITSRSKENWLTAQVRFRLSLGGLRGEELWRYCNAVVANLKLSLDRENQDYRNLLNKLEGNPLALRVILLRLEENSASELLAELEENFNGLQGDEGTKRIQAALMIFERGMDRAFAPVLRLLGLHEHFANVKTIGHMLNRDDPGSVEALVSKCFTILEIGGLCHLIGGPVYKLHPALRTCLTGQYPAEEADKRVFAETMSLIANIPDPNKFNEMRYVFSVYGANFHRAKSFARKLDMRDTVMHLTERLAHYAQGTRNFTEAETLFKELAEEAQDYNKMEGIGIAYHQLGIVAQKQRDLTEARDWYLKSLEIKQKYGDEHGMASTYHQLGRLAEEQRDFAEARDRFQKSLEILQKYGDEHGMALIYYQLGMIAEEQRDFAEARDWYQESLEIWQKYGDEHGMASTYHQLGRLAEEQRDFAEARDWYQESLEILQKYGDEHGMAQAYHQLGIVAQKQQDLTEARDWYQKSLKIWQKYGDEHSMAPTYHQLGMIAEEQRDFTEARDWYLKSLEMWQKYGDEHSMAPTYHQLGNIAEEQQDLTEARDWYLKSLEMWQKYRDEHGMAFTYGQLGIVAEEQRDFTGARDWHQKALAIFERLGDEYRAGIVKNSIDSLPNG
jgi:tetratricopeptide (TPR) repeat protein